MAHQRTKSRHDIIQQGSRLFSAWERGELSDERYARAVEAGERYLRNIGNLKSAQNAIRKDWYDANVLRKDARYNRTRAFNQKQIARSTYMGLSNG